MRHKFIGSRLPDLSLRGRAAAPLGPRNDKPLVFTVLSAVCTDRQQQERQGIRPDDGRRHIQNFRRRAHENTDIDVRARHAERRPEHAEKRRPRRALRSVVLPDHGRVHDGIDRRDHGAAKRSRQVFKVHCITSNNLL